ncbi:hypothetical protein D3C73_1004800 [compost metagenome]
MGPDQRQRLPADFIAIGRKLHARRTHLAQTVVDRDGPARAGENRDSLIGVSGIHHAVGIGPVIVAGAVLPHAVTTIDGIVELRTSIAVPEVEQKSIGVHEVHLTRDRCLHGAGAACRHHA